MAARGPSGTKELGSPHSRRGALPAGSPTGGIAVKRRLAQAATVLAVLMVVTGMAVPPAFAGSQSFKFSQRGAGAEGLWTTCPDQPAANVSCADTYLTAS